MIALDTNVLIRYVVEDDIRQSKLASQIINKYSGQKKSLFINNIVFCEFMWVLEKAYKYPRKSLVPVVQNILSTEEFVFENHDILWECFYQYETGKVDFSDILIGKTNQKQHNCEATLTFDKGTLSLQEFRLIS